MHTRRVLLVSIAMLVLALLVAPALAAQPVHRWAWNWNGVSSTGQGYAGDPAYTVIYGSDVVLSGAAFQTGPDAGAWNWEGTGTGVFVDRTTGVRAVLHVEGGGYGPGEDWTTTFATIGSADLTVDGVTQGTYPFSLFQGSQGPGQAGGLEFSFLDYPTPGHITLWGLYESAGLGGGGLHYR